MTNGRITHVRHIGLAVSELDEQAAFYKDLWGLTPVAAEGGVVFLAGVGSTEPYALRLRLATDERIDLIALGVASRGDVDWYANHVGSAGLRLATPPKALETPGGGYGFRFFDPEGRTIEISADVGPRAARPIEEREAIPIGLSHVVLNTGNLGQAVDFFVEMLGFRVSDWLEDRMCFLRCNPSHHSIALSAAPHVSLNHVAYEMLGIDEYMRGTGRLLRAGCELVWGPGRHGPGDNTFSYFRDPSGFICELTTALAQITDEAAWTPRVYRSVPEESDQWGTSNPPRPEEFRGKPDPGLWTPPPF